MNKAFLVFPHQLFEDNFTLSGNHIFVLVEDALYFKQYQFHQQKLVFHRASMQYYKAQLVRKNKPQLYFDASSHTDLNNLVAQLIERNIVEITYRYLVDDWLEQSLLKACREYKVKAIKIRTPAFLCDDEFLHENFKDKKHFSMATFYTAQRKRLGILLDVEGNPIGGKWSFDAENRKKLPPQILIPERYIAPENKYVTEAKNYVATHFSSNPGNTAAYSYAITHEEALKCLHEFLDHRFKNFGVYEDSISTKHTFLFHAVISPYLNVGLLTPDVVIDAALAHIKAIPLNSMEGFIRQIIGWREFMRAAYIFKGKSIRSGNFWNFKRKISSKFYDATTGILPVDTIIARLNDHAYSHHIERLMVMGNFMLLCEINPHEVYQWFMEMYIDAYDWVMVPNVYAMSQYACGGQLTTKPYISGSNYILKMSDFKKGDWCPIWDGLYWRFIDQHKAFFLKNPRLSMMARLVEQMDGDKLKQHYHHAETFLNDL